MKDNLIKSIQKFLNDPFRYSDLMFFLDKQKDLLLLPNILEKTEDCEYNALWDTIMFLQNHFEFGKEPNYIIGGRLSVSYIYNANFQSRNRQKH